MLPFLPHLSALVRRRPLRGSVLSDDAAMIVGQTLIVDGGYEVMA